MILMLKKAKKKKKINKVINYNSIKKTDTLNTVKS